MQLNPTNSQPSRSNPTPNNNKTRSQPSLFYPPRENNVNSQPSMFHFPKAIPQINSTASRPPLYYPPRELSQMNVVKSQPPLFYFPKAFPQINTASTQSYLPVVHSRVNPQHFPIPKEQSRLNNEMVFHPLPSNQHIPNNEQTFYHPNQQIHPHPPSQQNNEMYYYPHPPNQQIPNNNNEMYFHSLPSHQQISNNKVVVQQLHHPKDTLLLEIEDEFIKPNEQIKDEQIEVETIEQNEQIEYDDQIEFETIYPEEQTQINENFPTERIQNTSRDAVTNRFSRETESQRLMIYIIPDMQIESTYEPDLKLPTSELWFDYLNSRSLPRVHENNHCIAIDCEMVGVGEKGKTSVLARVSIVNYYGEILLDKFVKITRRITDYRTKFSGITPESLINAIEFNKVQKEVEQLMGGHIVVGQSIYFDFKALKTNHPDYLVRDTSLYNSIFCLDRDTVSLKKLAKNVLGINIQEGEHDSIEDARASMILYRHRQAEWEEYLKKNGFPKPRGCRICNAYHVVSECPYNRKNYKKRRDTRGRNSRNRRDDGIDYDEYNRDPNTSKYYSYSNSNQYNSYIPNYNYVDRYNHNRRWGNY
ncbi:3919_t:CDS:2 [Funneliformis caledonium]|uniref:RNA exonuclease 4 n=1 Tax=Funneliformis caledonium TaxID=1117310 RepID=A0A9N8ZVN3_9GLOM|nr:3919_t:CDS:2 [Funneliformis caledonium]